MQPTLSADRIWYVDLLEKALEKVIAPPQDEQDGIASQILESLSDEADRKTRLPKKAI